jgi:hypothetical protein
MWYRARAGTAVGPVERVARAMPKPKHLPFGAMCFGRERAGAMSRKGWYLSYGTLCFAACVGLVAWVDHAR